MKPNATETPLTERTVVRRGLLAGLAGLGAAAMLKVTGQGSAERAEAVFSSLIYPATPGEIASTNTAYNRTVLSFAAGLSGSTFQVNAAGGASGPRDAFYSNAGGNGGIGVVASGSGGTVATGVGVFVTGGSGNAGVNGSPGVVSNGGTGGSGATGGPGVQAFGGFGTVKFGDGVQGTSDSGKGVFGQSSSGDGVHGHSAGGVGLRGTSAGFVGLVGISDQSIGLYGFNQAGGIPAFVAENLAPSGARIAALFTGDVRVNGNFTVMPGFAKSAAVAMPDGSEAVVYCQESPEPYFEDFGRARLVNGVGHVQLESEFASIVKRDDYMVFLTPGGDASLYVGQQNANGFEVRETKGGTSNIAFTYRIVAKRKDIEGKRLARLDPQIKANIGQMRSAAAAKNQPSAKVLPGGNPLVPLEPIPPMPQPPAPRPER